MTKTHQTHQNRLIRRVFFTPYNRKDVFYMLNNIKDFVIAKKVAFNAGGGQSKIAHTAVNCLVCTVIGGTISFVISEIATVISAIKDGKELIRIRAAFLRNKD